MRPSPSTPSREVHEPDAAEAFEALTQGGLRDHPAQAWALIERAWPEVERWIGVSMRTVGVPPGLKEDWAQEVLLRIWKGRSGYRGSTRGELVAWLFRIGQREYYRLLDRRSRAPLAETDGGNDEEDSVLDARADPAHVGGAELAEHAEDLRTLSSCVRQLEPNARQLVELLYSANALTEREVALVIDVSKSQVNLLRQRALARLERCLRSKGVEA